MTVGRVSCSHLKDHAEREEFWHIPWVKEHTDDTFTHEISLRGGKTEEYICFVV